MRRAAIALAGLLAVILAWHTWRATETAVVSKVTPPTRPAIESDGKIAPEIESKSESDSDSESAVTNTQPRVTSPVALLDLTQEAQTIEESPAAAGEYSDSPIFITEELPSYLELYASQRDPNSRQCMTPFDLLDEMQALERDEASDARTEKNLEDILAPHPLGFPVAITCRGGICQISDLGPHEEIRERIIEYDTYWGEIQQRIYRLDPIASELATFSIGYAQYPEDPSQSITAIILTTKARVITADSLDCPLHNVQDRK